MTRGGSSDEGLWYASPPNRPPKSWLSAQVSSKSGTSPLSLLYLTVHFPYFQEQGHPWCCRPWYSTMGTWNNRVVGGCTPLHIRIDAGERNQPCGGDTCGRTCFPQSVRHGGRYENRMQSSRKGVQDNRVTKKEASPVNTTLLWLWRMITDPTTQPCILRFHRSQRRRCSKSIWPWWVCLPSDFVLCPINTLHLSSWYPQQSLRSRRSVRLRRGLCKMYVISSWTMMR